MPASSASRPNRWRLVRWSIPVVLLLLPAVAMRFTSEVNWTASDFVVMGVLLFGTVGAYELLARTAARTPGAPSRRVAYRAGAALVVVGAFLLVWINLAVGIIGSENNDVNALYLGVLAALGLGAALGRFRPLGMTWATAAAALVQLGIGAAAVASGWGASDPNWPFDTLGVTALFVGIWGAAAVLFWKAAEATPEAPAATRPAPIP